MGGSREMRVLMVVGREMDYPRNRVIRKALELAGCELEVIASEGRTYARRLPEVTWRLLRERVRRKGEPDVYLVGFLGHTIMPFLRPLTRRPVVFDPFVSLYETLCEDRMRVREGGVASRLLARMDAWTCHAADMVLVDTWAHAEHFATAFRQPRNKFVRLWVGADDGVYRPRDVGREGRKGPLTVFYYATFQPLHGVEVVLDAAERLSWGRGFRFQLVGSGPELPRFRSRLECMAAAGVLHWRPWAREEELAELMASADICLGGHFSLRPKADRVIPGKIYQFLASRKAVVAGDTKANRELLQPGVHALLVPRGDPLALAEAIQSLSCDEAKREELAENGYRLFKQSCSPAALSVELMEALDRLVAGV